MGIAGWLNLANPVQAAVVINEVHSQPATGSDWIELYNSGLETQNLTGWNVEDQVSAPTVLIAWTVETYLPAGEYLVVEVGQKLNNSGDGVVLKNAQGQILDQMNYSLSEVDKSWARLPNGNGSFSLQAPTRGFTNSNSVSTSPSPTPSPTPTATATPVPSLPPTPWPLLPLQASEINACPVATTNEWLELYNPDPVPYTLHNWKIRDGSGTSKIISATIPPQGLAVVSWSGSLLNNTGDSLSLETPDGQKLWEVEVGACQTGLTWIWYQGLWQLTSIPTPGVENQPDPVSSSLSAAPPTTTSSILAAPTVTPSSSSPTLSLSPSATTAALKARVTPTSSPLGLWQPPLLVLPRSPQEFTPTPPPISAITSPASSSPYILVRWISVILTGTVLIAVSGYQLYGFVQKRYLLPVA